MGERKGHRPYPEDETPVSDGEGVGRVLRGYLATIVILPPCNGHSGRRRRQSHNAETRRNAEKRREKEPSAKLCKSLRLCVKSLQPASKSKPVIPSASPCALRLGLLASLLVLGGKCKRRSRLSRCEGRWDAGLVIGFSGAIEFAEFPVLLQQRLLIGFGG